LDFVTGFEHEPDRAREEIRESITSDQKYSHLDSAAAVL